MTILSRLMHRREWIYISGLILAGCTAPRPPLVVTDPDPSVKIPAIAVAVQHRDLKAAPQLVQDLQSDDPAVRFYSIEALHKLTGERFGYLYYVDEADRQPALEKWQVWLKRKHLPATSQP